MERNEKPKDPNDPRNYLPVPQGGIILLGQTIIVVLLMALCLGVASAGDYILRTVADTVIKFVALAIISIGSSAAVAVLVLGVRVMWSDARRYWLRNVRGYRLACWLAKDSDGVPRLLWYNLLEPYVTIFENTGDRVILILPLGGWFRRPLVLMPKGREPNRPIRREQIHLRDPLFRFTLPEGAGMIENFIATHHLQLRDRQGDRMTVMVWHALKMFEMHGAIILTGPEYGLRKELDALRESAGRLTRERDEVQARLTREGLASEHAHRMWRNALGAIEDAIRRIKDSTRFGASIEALRIRLFLLERFRELVPTPDPHQEPQRAKWIGWADEEIASARADLARRDRHRRRPSAGAGA